MTETMEYISVASQVAAAAAAVFGLGFIGWQIRQAGRNADLQTLPIFLAGVKEHESRLVDAESTEKKKQSFVELLNFLETYAVALNGNLLPKVSRRLINDYIRDSIVTIKLSPSGYEMLKEHGVLKEDVTNPEIFEALVKFVEKNKVDIDARCKKLAQLAKSKEIS